MSLRQILHQLRSKRTKFDQICKNNRLQLDYSANKAAYDVLKDIFIERAYADYFPFYQKVNIVDVGAHYGYFSIFAAHNTAQGSRIISVEPSQQNYQQLQANLASNQLSTKDCLHAAISHQDGRAYLATADSYNHRLSNTQDTQSEEVQTLCLATLMQTKQLDTIDFLKLDCEGAEYDILESLPTPIFNKIGCISMEFHDTKTADRTALSLARLLKNVGFEIVKLSHGRSTMNRNYGMLIASKSLL